MSINAYDTDVPYTSNLRSHLVDLLQEVGNAAKHRSLAGNTGYAKDLEEVVSNLLFYTRGWRMKNANQSGPNEVAIDLINADHSVAVQVTIDAIPSKVRNTAKRLLKSRYNSSLKQIYVTGVHKTPKGNVDGIDPRVKRISLVDLLSVYDHNTVSHSSIEKAWNYLRNETRLREMLAVEDRPAIDYILSQLRCGAIRHLNFMESNYARMYRRIIKLKELILNGTVSDISHPAKSPSAYSDKEYRDFSYRIADSLDEILRILDQSGADLSGNQQVIDIGHANAEAINVIKIDLMNMIDNFCRRKNHEHFVTPVDRTNEIDLMKD